MLGEMMAKIFQIDETINLEIQEAQQTPRTRNIN